MDFTPGPRHAHFPFGGSDFLQAYVPKLQSVGWVCQLLRWQRGYEIPSSAAFGKIGDAYVAEVYRWAKAHGVPVRRFAKGENKEAIARR